MSTLDLPRNLRTRARREAPADDSGQVPRQRWPTGWCWRPSHEIEPGAPRTVAIWTPDAYDEFTQTDAGRTQPVLADGPRAQALLLQRLV